MKGSILPWSSGTLSFFERCIPSFTVAQCTLRTHESLTVRSANPPALVFPKLEFVTNSALHNECAEQGIRPPSKRIRARPKMPSSQTPESGSTRLVLELGPFVVPFTAD